MAHKVEVTLGIEGGLDEPIAVIGGIVEGSRAIETSLREWVAVARQKGHSWQEIADALGVTRQSAWERFKVVEESPDDILDSVMDSLAGYPGPTTDEMREMSRREEREIEERKKRR